MTFFTRRPAVIDAMQWDGSSDSLEKIREWLRFDSTADATLKDDDVEGPYISLHDRDDPTCDWDSAIPGDFVVKDGGDVVWTANEDYFKEQFIPLHDFAGPVR